jgi:hypothetical protein
MLESRTQACFPIKLVSTKLVMMGFMGLMQQVPGQNDVVFQ